MSKYSSFRDNSTADNSTASHQRAITASSTDRKTSGGRALTDATRGAPVPTRRDRPHLRLAAGIFRERVFPECHVGCTESNSTAVRLPEDASVAAPKVDRESFGRQRFAFYHISIGRSNDPEFVVRTGSSADFFLQVRGNRMKRMIGRGFEEPRLENAKTRLIRSMPEFSEGVDEKKSQQSAGNAHDYFASCRYTRGRKAADPS